MTISPTLTWPSRFRDRSRTAPSRLRWPLLRRSSARGIARTGQARTLPASWQPGVPSSASPTALRLSTTSTPTPASGMSSSQSVFYYVIPWQWFYLRSFGRKAPHAGSGVVRIDLLRFACFIVLLFIRAPFYVLLVFVAMCSVFWLFWISCQYFPSDCLERLLWGSLTVARGSSP